MELSHFQLQVRYDAHGSRLERVRASGRLSSSCYGCADKNELEDFLMNEPTLPQLLDYTCCTWAPVASQCSPHGGSGHFLFTYPILACCFVACLQEHSGSIIRLHLPSLQAGVKSYDLSLDIYTLQLQRLSDCNHILDIALQISAGAIPVTILQWWLPHPLHYPTILLRPFCVY